MPAPTAARRCSAGSAASNAVGESFTVYKVAGIDVALPRRESKIGAATRRSRSRAIRDLSLEEAARRRDFTVNAIAWDPLTDELRRSVRRTRRPRAPASCASSIRARSATTACACCARVQFAARFEFTLDPGTRGALPAHPARRPAGRADLGRDREAAAAGAAPVDRLRARARARRHRPRCSRS